MKDPKVIEEAGNADKEVIIRRAVAGDISQAAEIERLTSDEPWSREAIGHDISSNPAAYVAVMELGNGLCRGSTEEHSDGSDSTCPEGRGIWGPRRIIGYTDMWIVAGEAQLNNIAVVPEARGKGLGRALLVHMMDVARERGCSLMTLEVRIGNSPALALYRSCSFTEDGVRPSYYLNNNEDALLMSRKLG